MREAFHQINSAAEVRSLLLYSDWNCADPAGLRQRILSGFGVALVKQNPKRKIFRLDGSDKRTLYLKLFAPQDPLSALFRFYPRKEYQAAQKLEKLELPVIHYLAWGRLGRGGFCLSEGIPEAEQARQYTFETLRFRPELVPDFLEQLSNVTLRLWRGRIHHPDFHLGNILWSRSLSSLFLADPWGVEPRWIRLESDRIDLCLPWLELRGTVPESELLIGLQEAGLAADGDSALDLLNRASARHEQRIRRQWKKFSARIMSGRSKFATGVVLPEGDCLFRHTEWFSAPEKLELEPGWFRRDFPSEDASRELWLASFLNIPPQPNPPLARLVRPDGSSSLFYARRVE